jgi:hypothetical protein
VQTRQVITNKKIQIKVPQWADGFNGQTVLAWACDGGEAITHARLVEKSQGCCMHVRNIHALCNPPDTAAVACHESNLVSLAVLISSTDSMWPGQGLHRTISQTHACMNTGGGKGGGGQLALFRSTLQHSQIQPHAEVGDAHRGRPDCAQFPKQECTEGSSECPWRQSRGLGCSPLLRSTVAFLSVGVLRPRPNCDPGMTQHSAASIQSFWI